MAEPTGSTADDDVLVLHSTWRGIAAAMVGAVLLTILATVSVVSQGWTWLTAALVVAGAGSLLVVLIDLPIASAFTTRGVTRRALLRHQHLGWSRITRLRRQRVGILRTRRGAAAGGWTAEIGRRPHLLVDVMEGRQEFEQLVRILGDEAERLGVGPDLRPPTEHPPTWIARRRRWHPDSGSR